MNHLKYFQKLFQNSSLFKPGSVLTTFSQYFQVKYVMLRFLNNLPIQAISLQEGSITLTGRRTTTSRCKIRLHRYPFDKHVCTVDLKLSKSSDFPFKQDNYFNSIVTNVFFVSRCEYIRLQGCIGNYFAPSRFLIQFRITRLEHHHIQYFSCCGKWFFRSPRTNF